MKRSTIQASIERARAEDRPSILQLLSAVAAGDLVQPLLFGVAATDRIVLVATATVLLIATVAATLVPIQLATHTNPLVVLRDE